MTVTADLLIRNALVFDGTGSEPAIKDVAVYEGLIRATGQNLPNNAKKVVDADGLALMPGIIDSHTHFDAQITWDPTLKPSPAVGGLARRDGEAAVADHCGSHAERGGGLERRVPGDLRVVMGVAVDDAGHQGQPVGIHHLFRIVWKVLACSPYETCVNSYIFNSGLRARTVEYERVADQ